ncbi:MAG: PEP-utilizing enzyme [Bacillota bacterium]
MSAQRQFMKPGDVPEIPGTEGWERMYPYYYIFSRDDKEREEYENSMLWFYDGLHYPEAMYPFDLIWDEAWFLALSQNNTRIFMVPPAYGVDHRIKNGYVYITPVPVTDPKIVEERVQHFMQRAGYYYENWDRLYGRWKVKMEEIIGEVDSIDIADLPDMEDISVVMDGVGMSSGYHLINKYDRLISLALKAWQYHFEFLNLGYAAYVTFAGFCRRAFQGIEDGAITKMVSGIDVILFEPDRKLKGLAKSAVSLGVAEVIKSTVEPGELVKKLADSDPGRKWLEQLEESKEPWFYTSSGTGWYHDHWSWYDRPEIPFMSIRAYIDLVEKGESLERPVEETRRERDRIVEEYASLLRTDEDRQTFRQLLGISQTVYPYVEEHLFYVEHWFHTRFYMKVRELSGVFVKHGFFNDVEDIWYLNRFEIQQALYDLVCAWATGVKARGPSYWPREIEWRKDVLKKFRENPPPPALGIPPETVNEPFTIILWGITTERLEAWLDADKTKVEDISQLKGFAGAPGVIEGVARVVRGPSELTTLQEGEILVAPTTSPSWAPIFSKVSAVVTDVGGIMSHAAIVCREYGLPSVVGAGYATAAIKTGMRIRVNGNRGIVTIL